MRSGRPVGAAGIWLAPFLVGADTTLAREHPDWLVGAAGRNWGQDLVGLDLTHPGVRELLADAACAGCVDLGVDYLKLDFLYAGAVPGRRHEDVSGVEAYRSGLALVREAVGPDVYLSAAAHRSCRASASSTPCGSRRTPSTRAARTARPGCAA